MQELQKAVELYDLPLWLQSELEVQMPVGSRNNHCIRIAPALLRHGMSPTQAQETLEGLYPDARKGELGGVINRALVYAQEQAQEYNQEERQKQRAVDVARLKEAAANRAGIVANYPMPDLETTTIDLPLFEQRRFFLLKMFKPFDLIWIGSKHSSGEAYAHCFKRTSHWLESRFIPGEFISHSTYILGSTHRATSSIYERRYMVLESDVLDPSELAAIAWYLHSYHKLELKAIVSTGGVRHAPAPGLHFWFKYPGDNAMAEWAPTLEGYGADPTTFRGPQPVRLPGCIRQDTYRRQELLWIQP